ncbi:hypothetical protein BC828DRAFT_156414 [Blastocladiella britannica]|nr:hypothetical protein BC828DRAFT_156414 [Blastocladiella britannica]
MRHGRGVASPGHFFPSPRKSVFWGFFRQSPRKRKFSHLTGEQRRGDKKATWTWGKRVLRSTMPACLPRPRPPQPLPLAHGALDLAYTPHPLSPWLLPVTTLQHDYCLICLPRPRFLSIKRPPSSWYSIKLLSFINALTKAPIKPALQATPSKPRPPAKLAPVTVA